MSRPPRVDARPIRQPWVMEEPKGPQDLNPAAQTESPCATPEFRPSQDTVLWSFSPLLFKRKGRRKGKEKEREGKTGGVTGADRACAGSATLWEAQGSPRFLGNYEVCPPPGPPGVWLFSSLPQGLRPGYAFQGRAPAGRHWPHDSVPTAHVLTAA